MYVNDLRAAATSRDFLHGKNGFEEESKNSTKYRFENFVWMIKM